MFKKSLFNKFQCIYSEEKKISLFENHYVYQQNVFKYLSGLISTRVAAFNTAKTLLSLISNDYGTQKITIP